MVVARQPSEHERQRASAVRDDAFKPLVLEEVTREQQPGDRCCRVSASSNGVHHAVVIEAFVTAAEHGVYIDSCAEARCCFPERIQARVI